MNIPALKDKFLDSLDLWLEERVDYMLRDNSAMAIPSAYIKRGCHNIINRNKEKIGEAIDNASLFLTDEEGNVDSSTIFEDMLNILDVIEETDFNIGIVDGVIGKGKISFVLPDNLITNILFGNKKTITFDKNDFLELKSLMEEQS